MNITGGGNPIPSQRGEGVSGLSSPKQSSKPPQIEIGNTMNQWSFIFFTMSSPPSQIRCPPLKDFLEMVLWYSSLITKLKPDESNTLRFERRTKLLRLMSRCISKSLITHETCFFRSSKLQLQNINRFLKKDSGKMLDRLSNKIRIWKSLKRAQVF